MDTNTVMKETHPPCFLKTTDRTRFAASDGCRRAAYTTTDRLARHVVIQKPTFNPVTGELSLTARVKVIHTQVISPAFPGSTPLAVKATSTVLYEHTTQTIHDVADSGDIIHSVVVGARVSGMVYVKSLDVLIVSLHSTSQVRVYASGGAVFRTLTTSTSCQVLAACTFDGDSVWLGAVEDPSSPLTPAALYKLNVVNGTTTRVCTNSKDVHFEAVSCACEISDRSIVFASIGSNVVTIADSRGRKLHSEVTTGKRPNSAVALDNNSFLLYCGESKVILMYQVTTTATPCTLVGCIKVHESSPCTPVGCIKVHEASPLQVFGRAAPALPKLAATVSSGILTVQIPAKYAELVLMDAVLREQATPADGQDTLAFHVGTWLQCGLPGLWSGRVQVHTYAILLDPVTLRPKLMILSMTMFSAR